MLRPSLDLPPLVPTPRPASPPGGPDRGIRIRVRIALGLFVVILVAIGHRAVGLQLRKGKEYRERAWRQVHREVLLPPKRGLVLDRHGNRMAVSVDVPSVYANPREVGDEAKATARQLAEILDVDRFLLGDRLASGKYFAWVKRRVTPREAERVKALRLRGIYLTQETQRFYPNRRLAGGILGFAGLDGRGLEGVEKYFDTWLQGSSSSVAGLRDAHGRPVYIEGRPDLAPSAGHTLVLSIDKKLQFITETALTKAVELYQAKGGTAVVMDPYTGDVLAMASAPDFDPNNYGAADVGALRNRAVTDLFEPGSTMKVFTIAAALEARVIRLDEQIFCENGMIEIGKHKIKDSHPHKYLTPEGILQRSSNIGATKIAQRLGKRRLYTALRLLGFGHKTGVLLPGEPSGQLEPWRRWSEAKLSNVSFGQGMSVTAVQLATALSAVANGGLLARPRVVLEIRDAAGAPVVQYQKRTRRVFPASVTATVLQMMRSVVEKGGTGEEAAIDGYSVAGKTGTAQKVAATSAQRVRALADAQAAAAAEGKAPPKKAGYSEDLYLASFIGVLPASRPRLVIVVAIDEPKDQHYGGEVAGPVFREIGEQAMRYLGVPRDLAPRPVSKKDAKDRAREAPVDRPEPEAAPAPALPSVPPAGPTFAMPDLGGLGLAAVLERVRRLGVACQVMGTGRVVSQTPAAGPAPRATPCVITLAPPG